MKKKIIRWVVFSSIFFAVTFGTYVGYDWFEKHYAYTSIDHEVSPDRSYAVCLEILGELKSTDFETKVKIIVEDWGAHRQINCVYTSTIFKMLQTGLDYWDVDWQDDSVKVTLKNGDQKEKVFILPLC